MSPVLFDHLFNCLILLCRPRALQEAWLEALVPPVQALHVGPFAARALCELLGNSFPVSVAVLLYKFSKHGVLVLCPAPASFPLHAGARVVHGPNRNGDLCSRHRGDCGRRFWCGLPIGRCACSRTARLLVLLAISAILGGRPQVDRSPGRFRLDATCQHPERDRLVLLRPAVLIIHLRHVCLSVQPFSLPPRSPPSRQTVPSAAFCVPLPHSIRRQICHRPPIRPRFAPRPRSHYAHALRHAPRHAASPAHRYLAADAPATRHQSLF
mmetsp:Transcript_3946/g.7624  ORF Transcript_3946/g.7624 Transcript_3946/m.7624 type:complete len:268 (+) Transcript_3946:477-1280(+)